MKAYKIDLSMYEGKVREVVSEAVQKKAFKLGYKWIASGKELQHYPDDEYILFSPTGDMSRGNGARPSISAADFLSLSSAKDEPVFKPFDKVLVRNSEKQEWIAGFFAKRDEDGAFFDLGYSDWRYCIPYEGHEHLLGTTNNE